MREITQVFTYVNEEYPDFAFIAEVEVTCTIDEGTYDTPGSCDNEATVLSIERTDVDGRSTLMKPSDPDYPEIHSWANRKGMNEDNFDL